ncbi:MAG: hypothetical protein L3J39_07590 [Verrucomicrobiales bacterium]|nr:hypothetical protein [Verrucomicrobiales bacterium]
MINSPVFTFASFISAIYKIRLDHGLRIDQMVHSEEGLQARLEHLEVPDQTEAFVVGMDGANLPLREPGPTRGSPQERPKSNKNSSKWCSQLKNEVNGVQGLIRRLRYYSRKTKLSQVWKSYYDQCWNNAA